MTDDNLGRWKAIAAGMYECRVCGSEFNLMKRKPREKAICTRCYSLTHIEENNGGVK